MRIGTWITVPHPSIVDLLASLNFDWICVDMEHSPTSRLDLVSAVSIIQAHKKKAFVRISENAHTAAKYPLDAGVDGIIIPMVNSFEEAQKAVNNCFYPPVGHRGVGLSRAQKYGFEFEKHLEKNLKELELIVQIEHIKAVEQIDSILKIPEISGVFIGPYDLSGSMGIPGQLHHPRMKEAISLVAEKTLQAEKLLGAHVIQPDHKVVQNYSAIGYNFIAFSIDTYFLGQKVKDELQLLGIKS